MRRFTLRLLLWLFLPKGPADSFLQAAKKADRWDFAKCALLLLLVLLLLEEGEIIYAVWFVTAVGFAAYQYVWVFAYPVKRPVLYEETSLVFLMLVVVNHVAFALLCGAGWAGVSLLALTWVYAGRVVGRFAVAKEIKKLFHTVCLEYPHQPPEDQIAMAQEALETRIEDVREL